ncbi:PD-(D/E)XK nuclease family protein [Halorubrum amylolyticum]|uniref:hypothetical protein n=1 Tax=Halorubrum amylolyticum TaxID=2508724 RepID=UPI001008ABA7|nr:hypothetical protein [Halorubrum amylolyticum]
MTAPDRLSLAAPPDGPACPIAEIAAATRRDEARAAMATVSALRDRGVPVRDAVVVARDLDPYEEPLFRAAVGYGVTPVFWTQLRVTRTRPYALVDAVCAAFAADRADPETLLRPLEHRWTPAAETDAAEMDASWPVEPSAVRAAARALPADARAIPDWRDAVASRDGEGADPAIDGRVRTYVEWAADRAVGEPTPDAVGAVLDEVIAAYRRVGLPATADRDSPALLETETEARAVDRLRTLASRAERKYADRLADGSVSRSWEAVRELCRLLATQRPGRREHSNATAVDVMEANDVWGLSTPYVIAVGLVDGEWPGPTESVVPPELREAVLAGDGSTGVVAPRTAWGDGRDRDHFADAMRAATRGVVATRHARTREGDERRPSPYLAAVETDAVTDDARRRLTGTANELPAPIAAMLPEGEDGESGTRDGESGTRDGSGGAAGARGGDGGDRR